MPSPAMIRVSFPLLTYGHELSDLKQCALTSGGTQHCRALLVQVEHQGGGMLPVAGEPSGGSGNLFLSRLIQMLADLGPRVKGRLMTVS